MTGAGSAARKPGSRSHWCRSSSWPNRPIGPASLRRLLHIEPVVAARGRGADIAFPHILADQRRVAVPGVPEAGAPRAAVVELVALVQHDIGELGRRADAEGLVEAL